jgi:hypothetical protein
MNLQSISILCWIFWLVILNNDINKSVNVISSSRSYNFSSISKNPNIMSVYNNTLRMIIAIRKLKKKRFEGLFSKYKEKFIKYKNNCESLYYDASYKYYTLSNQEMTLLEEIFNNIFP